MQDRAYYAGLTDEIRMPMREQFPTAEGYYDTLLHELGHWTGHKDRLDRSLFNTFGSPDYAREELRAEIASMMLCGTLGIKHDPSQNQAYVKSWIKALQDDPKEIFRACADAEKIQTFVLGFEQKRTWMIDRTNLKVLCPREDRLPKMAELDAKRAEIDLSDYEAKAASPVDAAKAYFTRPDDGSGKGTRAEFYEKPEDLWRAALSGTRHEEELLAPRAESLITQHFGTARFKSFKEPLQCEAYLERYRSTFAVDDAAELPQQKEIAVMLKLGGDALSDEDRFRLSYADAKNEMRTARGVIALWDSDGTEEEAVHEAAKTLSGKVGGQALAAEGVETAMLEELKTYAQSESAEIFTSAMTEALAGDRIKAVLGWEVPAAVLEAAEAKQAKEEARSEAQAQAPAKRSRGR